MLKSSMMAILSELSLSLKQIKNPGNQGETPSKGQVDNR